MIINVPHKQVIHVHVDALIDIKLLLMQSIHTKKVNRRLERENSYFLNKAT